MRNKAVVQGAICRCDKGGSPSALQIPFFVTRVQVQGRSLATKADHLPIFNIGSFGVCKMTRQLCRPDTPAPWSASCGTVVAGGEVLSERAVLLCQHGGLIRVVDPGQSVLSVESAAALEGVFEMVDAITTEEKDNKSFWDKAADIAEDVGNVAVDGVHVGLDAASYVPKAGAIPDLANAAVYELEGKQDKANEHLASAAVDMVGVKIPGSGKMAQKLWKKVGGEEVADKAAKQAGKVLNKASKSKVGKRVVEKLGGEEKVKQEIREAGPGWIDDHINEPLQSGIEQEFKERLDGFSQQCSDDGND